MSNRGVLRTEATTGDVFKGVLKYFANFTDFLLKRDSNTGFFLLN